MKKTILAFTALSLAVIMSSCSKGEIIDRNSDLTPLKFRVSTGKITKSNSGEISSMNNRTITVFVYDADGTTNSGVIGLNGTPITSPFYLQSTTTTSETVNTYSDFGASIPLDLYLTADASVKFVAFAGEDEDGDEIDFSGITLGFNGTNATINGFESLPLNETVYAISDVIETGTSAINLNFRHIVSQVMFATGVNDDGVHIKITDLNVTEVPFSGDLSANSSGVSFTNYGVADYDLSEMEPAVTANMFSYTADNDDQGTARKEEFTSFFVLPYTIAGNAAVHVTYDIYAADGTTELATDKTADIYFSTLAAVSGAITEWTSAKRYTYIFKAGTVTPLSARITVTAEQSPWADDATNDIEAGE